MPTDSGKARRRAARNRYKPKKVRFMLIAEAPPSCDRFFYFEDVRVHDNLFRETMKVLYDEELSARKRSPEAKRYFLKRFQNDGFWLLDAIDAPIPKGMANARYLRQKSDLTTRLGALVGKGEISHKTPLIIVKATVYDAFFDLLVDGGYRVIDERIYFPGNGRQPEFREGFSRAVAAIS